MVSSGILRRVGLVRTDVSEELSASFVRVTRIGELGTMLAVASYSYRCSYFIESCHSDERGLSSFEMSVLTSPTRRNIPGDTILHGQYSRRARPVRKANNPTAICEPIF
jgi:hypothetical protein